MQPVQANKAHRHRRSSRRPRAVARFSNTRALLGGHDMGAEQRSLGAEPAKQAFIKRYSKCRQVTSRHLPQRVFSVVLGSLLHDFARPLHTHMCVPRKDMCVFPAHTHTHTHTCAFPDYAAGYVGFGQKRPRDFIRATRKERRCSAAECGFGRLRA